MADSWHEALSEVEEEVRMLEAERKEFTTAILDLVRAGSEGNYRDKDLEAWTKACANAGKFTHLVATRNRT